MSGSLSDIELDYDSDDDGGMQTSLPSSTTMPDTDVDTASQAEQTSLAILFTDIKTSSKLWKKHRRAMPAALDEHRQRMESLTEIWRGLIVKLIGDAFMISFEDDNYTERAVHCAIAIQKDLRDRPIYIGNSDDSIRLRVGVAYGEVNVTYNIVQKCRQKDYFGPVVNKASRMESKASPVGGLAIALSNTLPSDTIKTIITEAEPKSVIYRKYSEAELCNVHDFDKLKNSLRLLNVLNYECRSDEELAGVGATNVIIVEF